MNHYRVSNMRALITGRSSHQPPSSRLIPVTRLPCDGPRVVSMNSFISMGSPSPWNLRLRVQFKPTQPQTPIRVRGRLSDPISLKAYIPVIQARGIFCGLILHETLATVHLNMISPDLHNLRNILSARSQKFIITSGTFMHKIYYFSKYYLFRKIYQ